MSAPRFYLPEISAAEAMLPEDQSHHALHVLRMQEGDELVVFDGCGKWARGKLAVQCGKAYCRIDSAVNEDPPITPQITIACAIPKADRAATLVEQLSQVGVARLIWLDCRFSVVRPEAQGGKMTKWRRLALESAKQCGRNWLLAVEPSMEPAAVLELAGREKGRIFWAQPGSPQPLFAAANAISASGPPAKQNVFILIGPEGGWSDEEQKLLTSDDKIIPVRLNANILRIETAAVYAAVVVQAVMGR
jgi:16S rRNA (uracil1498-N3)-methyltransferase